MAQQLAIEEAIARPRPPEKADKPGEPDTLDPEYRAQAQTWSVHVRIAAAAIAIDWETATGQTWKVAKLTGKIVEFINLAVQEIAGEGGLLDLEVAAIHGEMDRIAAGLDEGARKN